MDAQLREAVKQSMCIRQDDESLDKENVVSCGSSTSEVSDGDSNQDYTDYACSLAPAGYASIPKADRDVVFSSKLLCMLDSVEEDGLAYIIGWQPHGRCFMVRDHKLILQILIRYLKISKWATFHRQLYVYGFKRITQGPDKGAYYHERFLRGRSFLAAHMSRVQTRGVRGRKKVTEEPNFWAMPWVKPLESKPPQPKRDHQQEVPRAHGQQETTFQVNRSPPRYSPPPDSMVREGEGSRVEQNGLRLSGHGARQYVGLSNSPRLYYLQESNAEVTRVPVNEPRYAYGRSSSAPLDSASSLHLLRQQVQQQHYLSPAPAATQHRPMECEREMKARMPLSMADERSPNQVLLAPRTHRPVFSQVLNGTPLLSSEQQLSRFDPRILHSSSNSYPFRYQGSPLSQSGTNHLAIRSSQDRIFLNHQENDKQRWIAELQQEAAAAARRSASCIRSEAAYQSPVLAASPPPVTSRTHSPLQVTHSPPQVTSITQAFVPSTRTGSHENAFQRYTPSSSPLLVSKNEAEQQVAEGLLMLGSN